MFTFMHSFSKENVGIKCGGAYKVSRLKSLYEESCLETYLKGWIIHDGVVSKSFLTILRPFAEELLALSGHEEGSSNLMMLTH